MFEDSLLESAGKLKSKGQKWTTLVSFMLQMVLIGVLVLIPLIYTEALPRQQLMTFLVAPPPPPPPPPPPAEVVPVKIVKIETELVQGQLRQPSKIPEKVQIVQEQEMAPPPGALAGVIGGTGSGGAMGGVIGGLMAAPVAVPKAAVPQTVRVSQGVAAGLLVKEVKPQYPLLARQARVQGSVVLQAVISKGGEIQNLRVASGHPMLVQAALTAVQQWRYKPYFLNGEPVEVETQITVNFTLSGG